MPFGPATDVEAGELVESLTKFLFGAERTHEAMRAGVEEAFRCARLQHGSVIYDRREWWVGTDDFAQFKVDRGPAPTFSVPIVDVIRYADLSVWYGALTREATNQVLAWPLPFDALESVAGFTPEAVNTGWILYALLNCAGLRAGQIVLKRYP
ncbi:TPA: hypothetical protein UOJ32_000323 [Stenotrophomonas maltophilia]|uniref:hypothetical protein n=2 Tax=Stenotrophomonas maltophilia TaxID=40324 RepID=UPI000747AF2A|nr:hypothetical protein [Stenotrophomonas maltophilia]KUP03514.1 hypothetical protein AR274_21560 [Stenotrophomonas maltophilia]HDS1390364.1 hypothetical protein [Stenotrophomonas maltophilia]HEL5328845.1 hypothetical protein [Stenotrophomonas maltophilia]